VIRPFGGPRQNEERKIRKPTKIPTRKALYWERGAMYGSNLEKEIRDERKNWLKWAKYLKEPR